MVHRALAAATTTAALLGVLATGCSLSRGRSAPPRSQVDACMLIAPPAQPRDTVVIGSLEAIEPKHAPRPQHHGERLAFAHLYETLVGVDCEGRVVPGLASSWSVDSGGRAWSLTLRDGAQFWDGTPVTATAVLASWKRSASDLAPPAIAVDERTLLVNFGAPTPDAALVLADPALAISGRAAEVPWPQGTTQYRVVGPRAELAGDRNRGRSFFLMPAEPRSQPVLELRDGGTGDARDLIDSGADVLLTADPGALDYVAAHPAFQTAPMPWEWTYVLLTPERHAAGLGKARARPDLADETAAALRHSLARDAVRSEARGAEPPLWWDQESECALPVTEPSSPANRSSTRVRSGRIVYQEGDRVARDLAERLVALAEFEPGTGNATASLATFLPQLAAPGTRVISAALPRKQLDSAIRSGEELAYIIALPRRTSAPCAETRRLLAKAPWLATRAPRTDGTLEAGSESDSLTSLGLRRAILPLVDTRPRLVVRRGVIGVSVDGHGTPRLIQAEPRGESDLP